MKKNVAKNSAVIDFKTLGLLAFMYAIIVTNIYLYLTKPLPLILHMIISVIPIHCAFTVWHEAAHMTVSNRRWINNLVGIFGMLPYKTPYFTQRWIHLQHHKLLNEKNDPNFIYIDGPFWQLPFRYLRGAKYMKELMKQQILTPKEILSDRLTTLFVLVVYVVAFINGFLLDVVLLWFIPFLIAKGIMDWYVNYIPHVGLPVDRYQGTRIIKATWLTPLILCHNYHAIHHLWPTQPWHKYIKVFKEKEHELISKGVPIEFNPFTAGKVTK
jgi:fatty acid desaturase